MLDAAVRCPLAVRCSLTVLAAAVWLCSTASSAEPGRPNIVVILADDLGYGDVRAFNPEGKIPTPRLDRLAAEGMRFTDAHSGSAVCTPTRYGLMTGRYAWRGALKSGVLGGLSPRLIEPGRPTVASLLKGAGYHTACVGKWHLGMDWRLKPGKKVTRLGIEPRGQVFNVLYNEPIANGPNAVGFDEYFGISASLDMVPYTYIRNDRVAADPTEDRDFPMWAGREDGARNRKGPTAPDFDAANVLPDLTREAVRHIGARADAAKAGEPFFLYLPLASPHTPILPVEPWLGRSGLGAYADFVMATDAAVGEVLDALAAHELSDDTLVVFTSDNGCSPQANFADLLEHGHRPSHHFRGAKADIFEGGHRVPFIARWPGKVAPASTTERLTCLTDLFATCAEVAGAAVPAGSGEDSVSFRPTLLGRPEPPRPAVVHHSINGSFAIREGTWKLCLCPDSGGWSSPRPGRDKTDGLPPVQLFDLATDIGETTNLADRQPDQVRRLTTLLETLRTPDETQ